MLSSFKFDNSSTKAKSPLFWVPILLVLVGSIFHLVTKVFYLETFGEPLANFSPFMALALCGGLFFPRLWMVLAPIAVLIVADLLVGFRNPAYAIDPLNALLKYGCFLAAIGLGFFLRNRVSGWGALGTSIGCALAFYLVMNTVSWLSLSAYPKTLGGWWMSQTTGLPGFPYAYFFFLKSLVGDLGFTALSLISLGALGSREETAGTPELAKQNS